MQLQVSGPMVPRIGNQPTMRRPVQRAAEPLTDGDCFGVLSKFGRGPCARRNVALFRVLWRTGLRLDEALSLHLRDLKDGPPAEMHVRRGKGSVPRIVGVSDDANASLTVWLSIRGRLEIPGVFIFPTLQGAKLNQGYVRRTLAKKGKEAGVQRRVHPHGLRHTFARNMSRAGVRIEDIRDALGHSTIAVTDCYLRGVSAARVVEAMVRQGVKE